MDKVVMVSFLLVGVFAVLGANAQGLNGVGNGQNNENCVQCNTGNGNNNSGGNGNFQGNGNGNLNCNQFLGGLDGVLGRDLLDSIGLREICLEEQRKQARTAATTRATRRPATTRATRRPATIRTRPTTTTTTRRSTATRTRPTTTRRTTTTTTTRRPPPSAATRRATPSSATTVRRPNFRPKGQQPNFRPTAGSVVRATQPTQRPTRRETPSTTTRTTQATNPAPAIRQGSTAKVMAVQNTCGAVVMEGCKGFNGIMCPANTLYDINSCVCNHRSNIIIETCTSRY